METCEGKSRPKFGEARTDVEEAGGDGGNSPRKAHARLKEGHGEEGDAEDHDEQDKVSRDSVNFILWERFAIDEERAHDPWPIGSLDGLQGDPEPNHPSDHL